MQHPDTSHQASNFYFPLHFSLSLTGILVPRTLFPNLLPTQLSPLLASFLPPARPPMPAHLVLADVVGGDEDADTNGDEDEADDEEGRQHRARRQDGLPGGQALLLERRVVRLAGLHRSAATRRGPAARPAARGVPVRLLLSAVVDRHGAARRQHRQPRPRTHHVTYGRHACALGEGARLMT